ncbi:MAG: hypothetical protein ACI9RV_003035, partial [Glaciecola sp.]
SASEPGQLRCFMDSVINTITAYAWLFNAVMAHLFFDKKAPQQ